jgi:uncharacterized membrane protein required for colicin V production
MGLDLALSALVLMAAIRGWLKGFVVQAIRLGGVVAAVYASAPVREQARPYIEPYLQTIRPELLDRGLWWACAVISYFVIAGAASLIIAVARRPRFGIEEPKRGDQFAGFGLGIMKGLILASFAVAGLQSYGEPFLSKLPWVDEQSRSSYAWEWNTSYHPAARIWNAPPVQHFVAHVQRMGLMAPAEDKDKPTKAEPEKGVQTASRTAAVEVAADSWSSDDSDAGSSHR